MDHSSTPQQSHTPAGKERRAHTRYPVSIPLDIKIEGIGIRQAQARDFCIGGLLVAFDPANQLPSENTLSGSLCLITLHIEKDDYRLRARITHADAESAGIAFVNLDRIAMQALQRHAKIDAQPSNPSPEAPPLASPSAGSNTSENIQKSKILTLCNAVVQSSISPTLDRFLDHINDSFFNTAKKSQDLAIQNLHFQALEHINNNKKLIHSSYANAILGKLQNNHNLHTGAATTEEENLDTQSLELITDEEFNTWLANSKVTYKIESELPQALGMLEQRLSYIYGEKVDRRNNPYGPCVFVHAFQKTLESLELRKEVLPACYDAFKLAMLEKSKQLYYNINKIFIDNGILVNLKEVIAQSRKVDNQKAKDAHPANNPQSDKQSANSTEEIATEVERNGHITQHNLYELVGEIRHLQTQLKQYTDNKDVNRSATTFLPAPDTGTVMTPARPAYNTAEALDIMTKISISPKQIRGDGQALVEFREQLNAFLAQQQANGTDKTFSPKQGQVLDVTENVFASLLNDLQVAQSVRPWLEKLAIPVMKMALVDENIFIDKNHVVREVINKLADLEVLASAENTEEQAAVRQAFNWIINLVNNEFDGTTNVYTRAAQQLDLLIKVQQQSFERNIKEVVAEAIRDEREHAKPITHDDTKTSEDVWLRMVSRLKENHWVLFDANSDIPKRLKVAWLAPRKGKFVFVNVMGRKDRICTNEQLAELFRLGEAIVLDGTDDPAMDRAQYTMLQKLHKQLLYQSSHDELTGLINRREFMICMQHALDDAIQNKTKHAVCFLDIDNFKVINNNYGYDAGDKLLNQMVELIQPILRENNVLSRIGADHFALLIQGVSMDDAAEMIEDIMDNSREYRFEWEDNRMSVTLSAGIAMINGSVENMIDLLHSAESSCSMAKESGGDQIQIYHTGSNRLNRRKKESEWATKIDKALDENALFLRCQKIEPIQPHLDTRPHYEVLLGISDELGGNGALESFIQAAEHHNRMSAVDRWVIQNTFQWLARNEQVVSDISVFTINLSGQSLNNDNLIDFIYQQVSKTSAPIENICFEITETSGVTNLSDAADFIQTIKSTGCQFALDDFGSGMSSYSYLKNLPVDYLKIDGIFIKDITSNQNDFAVVKSICEIGHFMDKTVIAEFVQDNAAKAILTDIGVDYAQGYGIAKPHALNDLLS